MMRAGFLFATLMLMTNFTFGHEGDHDNVSDRSKAVITMRAQKWIVEANGLPDHQPGQFPNRGNPNSISAQHYHFEMPLHPRAASRPTPIRGFLFGVAINGVVFDPGTAEVWRPGARIVSRPGPDTRFDPRHDPSLVWNYEGMGRMNLGIDDSHAHVQPTGAYHYHGLPTGLINRLRAEQGRDEMLLIGYAADGFPIYAEYGHASADDASSPLVKLQPSGS
jgi:YHYH protein